LRFLGVARYVEVAGLLGFVAMALQRSENLGD
jgi:hypothetical protein